MLALRDLTFESLILSSKSSNTILYQEVKNLTSVIIRIVDNVANTSGDCGAISACFCCKIVIKSGKAATNGVLCLAAAELFICGMSC